MSLSYERYIGNIKYIERISLLMPTRTTFLPEALDLKVLAYAREHGITRIALRGTADAQAVPNMALAIRRILEEFFSGVSV
jgi:hypothetical protein